MPAERIAMRLVREILRLITAEQLSVREAARRTGKAPSTVRATLGRCRAAGLSWPLPEGLSDSELEERLYGKGGAKPGPARRAEPDWASIHRELKRKHVTLSILWEEYIAQQPDGLRYSRFCELYRTLRRQAAGGHAPDPCCGREAVRGLRRRHGAGRRGPAHRREAPGADFRGGAGRVEPFLRRSHLDAEPSGLDRGPCPCPGSHRRRTPAPGAGQHQGGRHQGLLLRSASQPDL